MNQNLPRGIVVKGNTYPMRQALNAIGCHYDFATRNMYAPTAEVLRAAYRIMEDYRKAEELARMTPELILEKSGKTARGNIVSAVRNNRRPPPIGALVAHQNLGMLLVVKCGECFFDETVNPAIWRSRYQAIPVSDDTPEAAGLLPNQIGETSLACST